MLIKDYQSHKKSITITLLILSFLLFVGAQVTAILGIHDNSDVIWASFLSMCILCGMYYQKRLKASMTGIEISEEKHDLPKSNTK